MRKFFIEMENGYVITETTFSNNGTGLVGINLYDNLIQVTDWKGNEFRRIPTLSE